MRTATPQYVEDAPSLARVLQLGTTRESSVLEFKGKVEDWAPKEVARDLAALANTWGGVVLYGVVEKPGADGVLVADRLKPVENVEVAKEQVLRAAINYLVPNTITIRPLIVPVDGGHVLAVNVPPSGALVSVYDRKDGTAQFMRRTEHGKEHMNPDEALRFALDRTRVAYLEVQDALSRHNCTIASDGGLQPQPNVTVWPGIFREKLERGPNTRHFLTRNSEAHAKLVRVGERTIELWIAASNPVSGHLTLVVPLQAVVSCFKESSQIGLLLSHKIAIGRDNKVWLAATAE